METPKTSPDPKKSYWQRTLDGIQNVCAKIVGFIGTGILAYLAISIAASIAMFFLKSALTVVFAHALCTSPHFKQFRHHLNELIIAPVRAWTWNNLLMPVMNAILKSWNGFWAHSDRELKDLPDDVKGVVGYVTQTFPTMTVNFLIGLHNAIAGALAKRWGGVELYKETDAGYYRADPTKNTGLFIAFWKWNDTYPVDKDKNPSEAQSASYSEKLSHSLVTGFFVGTWNWSTQAFDELRKAFFSSLDKKTDPEAVIAQPIDKTPVVIYSDTQKKRIGSHK